MRRIGSVVLIALSMLLPGTVAKAAAEKVECSQLDLQFTPADKIDRIECKVIHWSDPDDDADGASAEYELLTADMGRMSLASPLSLRERTPISTRCR